MNRFATMPDADRRVVITEAAERLQIKPVIVEKDFWVCWLLGLLFEGTEWSEALVFKGGTALSKVFGIIRRFSEDIDLSVSPATLGISEAEVERAGSRRQRDQWMQQLEAACGQWVAEKLQPGLEQAIRSGLGQRRAGADWLQYEIDATTHSPVVLFNYPSILEPGSDYIRRWVKLEFGSLTDQRPTAKHRVRPWLADILPPPTNTMDCEVVALEVERAFWEKTTILHAEHHRDASLPLPRNYARHYADVAAIAGRQEAERAVADDALRERVVAYKTRFFARSWARYDLAKPGTFRLMPPPERMEELKRDYREMRDMFLDLPPSFESILTTLQDLEKRINRTT